MKKLFKIFRKKKKNKKLSVNYDNYSLQGLLDFANNPDLYERKLLIERQRFNIEEIKGAGEWVIRGSSTAAVIRNGGWIING